VELELRLRPGEHRHGAGAADAAVAGADTASLVTPCTAGAPGGDASTASAASAGAEDARHHCSFRTGVRGDRTPQPDGQAHLSRPGQHRRDKRAGLDLPRPDTDQEDRPDAEADRGHRRLLARLASTTPASARAFLRSRGRRLRERKHELRLASSQMNRGARGEMPGYEALGETSYARTAPATSAAS